MIVKPAYLGDLDHTPATLNLARFRAIHLKRQVRSPPVVVAEVTSQDSLQLSLIQGDDVVQAFPADAANQPFDEWILPGTAWSD
jgi:hypothetical protein